MTPAQFTALLTGLRDKHVARLRKYGVIIPSIADAHGYVVEHKETHNATSYDINNGDCDTFAQEVQDAVPDAEEYWIEDMAPSYDDGVALDDAGDPLPSHCVIKWRGRFYDAECVTGVPDWRQLPCIQNKGKTREQVLRERGEWVTDDDRCVTDPNRNYQQERLKT